MVLLAALWWALESPAVQEKLVATLLPRLEAYLERDISVGRLRYSLVPLAIEIEDAVLAGPTPEDPPVATARRLRVAGDWADLAWGSRRLVVQEVDAEGLTFFYERYADGTDNLPRPMRRRPPRDRPLELEIGSLRLADAHFRLEEHTTELDLEAEGIRAALLGAQEEWLQGRVTVDEVRFTLPRGQPYAAALAANVVVGREGMRLRQVQVRSPHTALAVTGDVTWKGDKQVELAVDGWASDELIRRLGYLEVEDVGGRFDVAGTFEWNPGVWGFRGDVLSDRLRLLRWDLDEVMGVVAGDRNGVRFDLDAARYGGGRVEGEVVVDLSREPRHTAVDLTLGGVDLESFLRDAQIPVEDLAGRLVGTLAFEFTEAAWQEGSGWGDFRVQGEERRGGGLALSGSVPLVVDRGIVRASAVRLEAPAQQIQADARYDLGAEAGTISFAGRTEDVGGLTDLFPLEEEDGTSPLWLPEDGVGTFDGVLELSAAGNRVSVAFDLADPSAPGLAASRAVGTFSLGPEGVDRLRVDLSRAGGAALVSGRVPFGEGEAWSLALDVATWPIADAAPWLPVTLPVEGPFTGSITLTGQGEAVRGEVFGEVAPAVVGGVEAERLLARLRFDESGLTVEEGVLTTPAGALAGEGDLRFADDALAFVVRGEGLDVAAEPLTALLGGRAAGRLDLRARIGGTLAQPRVEAEARGGGLRVGERILGGDGGALLEVSWEDERLAVSGSLLGLVDLQGGGRLTTDEVETTLSWRAEDLAGMAALVPAELPEVTGSAAGTLVVAGPLAGGLPDVRIEVTSLDAEVGDFPLRNLEPLVFELEDDRVEILSFYVGGPEGVTEVFVSGDVGLAEPHPLDLRLQASFPNRWLDPFLPDLQLTGASDVLATIRGDVGEPRVNGQAAVRDAALLAPALAQTIEGLEAIVLFYPDAVVLDSAEGRLGDGVVRASGRLAWPPGEGAARFQIAARDVSFRYPEGWLLRGDAELVWTQDRGDPALRGVVTLDRAYYLRDVEIGLVPLLQRFLRRTRREAGDTGEGVAAVDLNVLLRAPGSVRIRNNLADLRGSAELTLRGSLARPVLFGRAEAEAGGTLVYSDNEYRVERAVLTFANPYRIEPVLDLVATTEVAEYDVTLSLFGSLERLNASFSSDPPLADVEVLSLLLSGAPQTVDRIGQLDQDEGAASAAEGLLFGQAAALVTERVGSLFGFDAFRIEPLAAGGETVSSARVTVGKRLSSDLYVTYSYDPSSTEEQRIQVRWEATEGLLVLLTQRGDAYAVDLLWERRF